MDGTGYTVNLPDGELVIEVGKYHPALDRALARSQPRRRRHRQFPLRADPDLASPRWFLIPASDPGGRRLSAEDNATRVRLLRDTLERKGVRAIEARAGESRVPCGFVTLGMTMEDATRLCQLFEQGTLLWGESGAPARREAIAARSTASLHASVPTRRNDDTHERTCPPQSHTPDRSRVPERIYSQTGRQVVKVERRLRNALADHWRDASERVTGDFGEDLMRAELWVSHRGTSPAGRRLYLDFSVVERRGWITTAHSSRSCEVAELAGLHYSEKADHVSVPSAQGINAVIEAIAAKLGFDESTALRFRVFDEHEEITRQFHPVCGALQAARSPKELRIGHQGGGRPLCEVPDFLDLYEDIVIAYYREMEIWPLLCSCGRPAAVTDIENEEVMCMQCLVCVAGFLLPDDFETLLDEPESAFRAVRTALRELVDGPLVPGAFHAVVVARIAIDAVNGDEIEIRAIRQEVGWYYVAASSGTEVNNPGEGGDSIAGPEEVIEMVQGLDAGGDNLWDIEQWPQDDDAYPVSVLVVSPLYQEVGRHFNRVRDE